MAGLFGIGVRFTFDSRQAVKAMKKTDRAFRALGNSARKTAKSLAPLGRAMKVGLAVGAAVFAATAVKAVSVAANFEAQMSAVGAVSNATAKDMARLSGEAKRMGATTSFSAIQAAQGQELLARAGFNTEQIIGALPGVMNAAAAEGMDLASAADIVANTLKGFGKDASEAGHVADVLALASAKSNTSMVGLGEGIKMSVAQMSTLGVSLEDTTAALGALADSGLKGTMGGTALTNMFVKLTKPSKAAAKQMKKWNFSLTDGQGKTKKMGDLVNELGPRFAGVKDAGERAALMTELFGIRGAKAFAALQKKGGDSINQFSNNLVNSTGSASKMAAKRLDNLKGAFTLFSSALEGMFIETGSVALKPLTQGIQAATKFLSDMVLVLQGNDTAMAGVSSRARQFAGVIQGLMRFVSQVFAAIRANWPAIMAMIGPSLDKLAATLSALFPEVEAGGDATVGVFITIASALIILIEAVDKTIKVGVFLWEMFKGIGVAIGWLMFKVVDLTTALFGTGLGAAIMKVTAVAKVMVTLFKLAARVVGSIFKRAIQSIGGALGRAASAIRKLAGGFKSLINAMKRFAESTIVQGALSIMRKLSAFKMPSLRGGSPSGASPSGGAPPVRAPASANIREVGAANVGRASAPVRVELGGADSSVQKVVIENRLMLDGRQIAHNLARQELSLKERSGESVSPGKRRAALELGRIT